MITALSGAFYVGVLGCCAVLLRRRLQPSAFRRLVAGAAAGSVIATVQVLLIGPAYPLWLAAGGFALVMLVMTRGHVEVLLPGALLEGVPVADDERARGRRIMIRLAVAAFVVAVVIAAVVNA